MQDRDKSRLLANLKSLPNELEHLVKGLSAEELRWRPISGKWSINEVLVGIRDAEREVFQARIRRTLSEDSPVFELWDNARAAGERGYNDQDGHAALAEFRELRGETVRMLEGVPAQEWGRTGVHPAKGPATLEEQVVRQIKNHDLTDLVQIKDILRIKMPW